MNEGAVGICSFLVVAVCSTSCGADTQPATSERGAAATSLPMVLYDRGVNVPTVLAEYGETLYAVESSPDEAELVERRRRPADLRSAAQPHGAN